MKHRLIAELLRLAYPAPSVPGQMIVSPPPTHAELAARIASQRETVTRELRALEHTGLIGRRHGAIVLLDPGRMRRLVAAASQG